MAREVIIINGKEFQTKKSAKEHFRSMLARCPDGAAIVGEDEADLFSLLTRHPEVQDKVGVGIDGFYADQGHMGTRCFYLRRHDGSKTDFSFHSCVDGRAPTPQQEFLEAARMAVQSQIRQAKLRHYETHKGPDGTVPCDLSGQPLRLDEAHVDHAEPMTFEVIVQGFLAAHQIENPAAYVTDGADMQHVATFKERAMAEAFKDYHRRLARLRWVAKEKNLSLGPKHQLRHRRATVSL